MAVVERFCELPGAVWTSARAPGERTAVALVVAHGYWRAHPGFVYTCVRTSRVRVRVAWPIVPRFLAARQCSTLARAVLAVAAELAGVDDDEWARVAAVGCGAPAHVATSGPLGGPGHQRVGRGWGWLRSAPGSGGGGRPAACVMAVAGEGVCGPCRQPPLPAHAARHAATILSHARRRARGGVWRRWWGRWSPVALARAVRAAVAVVVGVELARQAVPLSVRGGGRRREPVVVGEVGRVSLSEVERAQQRYAREVRRRFTWQLARMEKRILRQGAARSPDTLSLVLLAAIRRELGRRRQEGRRRTGR